MKVAILSESPADEAAVRTIAGGLLAAPIELELVGAGAHNGPGPRKRNPTTWAERVAESVKRG
jgi:hypothetical protein